MLFSFDSDFLFTMVTLSVRVFNVITWYNHTHALTVVSCCGTIPNPSRQYSKRQTRGEEIEKCLDEGLEPTYYFSIFNICKIPQWSWLVDKFKRSQL